MNAGISRVELRQFVDRETMQFVRVYAHPIERVWSALIDPAQISAWWIPCSTLEPREGGRYVFDSPGGTVFKGRIHEFNPPRVVDFSGVTRFELFPLEGGGGCRMVLTIKRWPNGWSPTQLAGFHAWLDRLVLHLDGANAKEIDMLEVWAGVFQGYEMLVRRNISDGAKVVHRVHFATNSAALRIESNTVLDEVVAILKNNSQLKVEVSGNCDDPCSWEESVKLAMERSQTITRVLEEAGISKERIFTFGGGNFHQLVPSDSEEGRAFNRRVELRPIY
jgi:hypothetical protein